MSVIKVNHGNFKSAVLNNDNLVLLDFWATWCGPCQMIAPVIAEIAEENPEYFVGKVNVDEEPELAEAFAVTSIPTLVVMKNGKVINKAIGFRQKQDILAMLEG
ncbi:MAG: thioredoxin [Ruminococcus sp.]|nr:thioredoxin [Ruminococcus sp.]